MSRWLALCALIACNQVGTAEENHSVLHTTEHAIEVLPTATSSLKGLDDAHFDAAIKERAVFVEFYAPWCGACKAMVPSLERLQARHLDVAFYRVDVDQNPISAKKQEIVMVPTMVMFHRGVRSGSLVGAYSDDVLDRFVEGNSL